MVVTVMIQYIGVSAGRSSLVLDVSKTGTLIRYNNPESVAEENAIAIPGAPDCGTLRFQVELDGNLRSNNWTSTWTSHNSLAARQLSPPGCIGISNPAAQVYVNGKRYQKVAASGKA
ncbi:uncharacterized protein MCYG_06546 [Microsporum canis CBS 113480]|uniref:Uncharacterized protein n=1 Tax=Arthroderma otae (strain ATCC MYA-4605 / CBS 113480) TaxID=554155 RepID=C5FUZ3_ARTOC|nr:uncharacterized protein MCYG_06546 [Microsporum canis CBS 113480]EEQ33727.1 predicted protein [Microsporum canis CBS 113480]